MDVIEVDEKLPFGEIMILAVSLDPGGKCLHLGQHIHVFQPEILFAEGGDSNLTLHWLRERKRQFVPSRESNPNAAFEKIEDTGLERSVLV